MVGRADVCTRTVTGSVIGVFAVASIVMTKYKRNDDDNSDDVDDDCSHRQSN